VLVNNDVFHSDLDEEYNMLDRSVTTNMNKYLTNILLDLNPKNCLSKFQNPSKKYAILLLVITYGVGVLIQLIIQDHLPNVAFHKEALFSMPQTAFNSAIFMPIIEDILFFGIPTNITNNPIIVLIIGSMWSIAHLFSPMDSETYSLALNSFFATVPVLFIHFKIWKSSLGWMSIIAHGTYNAIIQLRNCGQYITQCNEYNVNNFEFPEFYIVLGISIFSICIVYFLQRRKEEKEYIKKILKSLD